jgi:hypothetical protein
MMVAFLVCRGVTLGSKSRGLLRLNEPHREMFFPVFG